MLDAVTVHNCLRGIQFPASPAEIGEQAMQNGDNCPSEIVADLRQVPFRLYQSEHEVAARAGGPPEST